MKEVLEGGIIKTLDSFKLNIKTKSIDDNLVQTSK